MTDIALVFNEDTLTADLAINDGDLVSDNGFETAVIMSLLTDARASDDDDIPDGTDDKRGWWADAYLDRPFGSKLWLLSRAKQLLETLVRAEYYAEQALQWLIDDGVAREVIATASYPRDGVLALLISIRRPRDIQGQWQRIWEFELNG